MFCRIRQCVCFPFLVNFRLHSSCCRLIEATFWGYHHPFRTFFVVDVYLVNKREKRLAEAYVLLLFRTFLCVIACGKTVFLWFFCSERLFILVQHTAYPTLIYSLLYKNNFIFCFLSLLTFHVSVTLLVSQEAVWSDRNDRKFRSEAWPLLLHCAGEEGAKDY